MQSSQVQMYLTRLEGAPKVDGCDQIFCSFVKTKLLNYGFTIKVHFDPGQIDPVQQPRVKR